MQRRRRLKRTNKIASSVESEASGRLYFFFVYFFFLCNRPQSVRQLVPARLTRVKDKQTAGFKADSSLPGRRTELCPGKTSLMLLKSQVAGRCSGAAAPRKHVFSRSPPSLRAPVKKKTLPCVGVFFFFLHFLVGRIRKKIMFFLRGQTAKQELDTPSKYPAGHLPAALVKLSALTTSQMDLSCPLTSLNGASPFLQQAA